MNHETLARHVRTIYALADKELRGERAARRKPLDTPRPEEVKVEALEEEDMVEEDPFPLSGQETVGGDGPLT